MMRDDAVGESTKPHHLNNTLVIYKIVGGLVSIMKACFKCGSSIYEELEINGELVYKCINCEKLYDLESYLKEERMRSQKQEREPKRYRGKRRINRIFELGGKCSKCGFDNIYALELHHISEHQTILLCANCHKILHAENNHDSIDCFDCFDYTGSGSQTVKEHQEEDKTVKTVDSIETVNTVNTVETVSPIADASLQEKMEYIYGALSATQDGASVGELAEGMAMPVAEVDKILALMSREKRVFSPRAEWWKIAP